MYKKKFYLLLLLIFFLFSACGRQVVKFQAGDIQKDFCGTHLNYQYCQCAFRNEFCNEIVMNKKQAKEYMDKVYTEWVRKEKQNFKTNCQHHQGIYKNGHCEYCREGEQVVDNKCQ